MPFRSWLKKVVPLPVKRELLRLSSENSVEIALASLATTGFSPRLIIDIGAYVGNWTRMARRIFPDSSVLMVEALEEKRGHLARTKAEAPHLIEYEIALLASERRENLFYVMETGSSVYRELTDMPRQTRTLKSTTLDELVKGHRLPEAPWLLKLDVQGAELDVLDGASACIENSPVVLLEVSVVPYNEGAPDLKTILLYMESRGYRLLDVAALMRQKDGRLCQLDVIFWKTETPLS